MTEDGEPLFKAGDRVRVMDRSAPGHCRTPGYVKGRTGWVERYWDSYRNPEDLAYGGDGLPRKPLYRVAFYQRDVWGQRYTGPSRDTIRLDIYEHWLEAA